MTNQARNDVPEGQRELLVLRHAKSAWDSDAVTDRARPLSARGQRDAPRMGALLASRGLLPEFVLASPARRAQETVALLLTALGGSPVVQTEDRLYGPDLASLLEVIGETDPAIQRLLIVGHNPGLEILVQFLAESSAEHGGGGKFFPTCTLAHLRTSGDWHDLQDGASALIEIVRPRELDR